MLVNIKTPFKAIVITMFLLVGLLVIIGFSFNPEKTTTVDDPTAGVRQAYREFIGRSLNDPIQREAAGLPRLALERQNRRHHYRPR